MKRRFAHTVASFFAFFCVLFIPFPFNIITVQVSITDFIFGKLIGTIASTVFGKTLSDTRVYSDTVSMYILVLVLFIFAILVSVVLLKIKKWRLYREKVLSFFYSLFVFYLALQLLKYGVDKIFKNQFYLPEPIYFTLRLEGWIKTCFTGVRWVLLIFIMYSWGRWKHWRLFLS